MRYYLALVLVLMSLTGIVWSKNIALFHQIPQMAQEERLAKAAYTLLTLFHTLHNQRPSIVIYIEGAPWFLTAFLRT